MQQIDGLWDDALKGVRRRVRHHVRAVTKSVLRPAPPPAPRPAPPPAPRPAGVLTPRDVYNVIERHSGPLAVSPHVVSRVVEAMYDNLGNTFMHHVWPLMSTKRRVDDIDPALERYALWRKTVVAPDLARLRMLSALCPDVYAPVHMLIHGRLDKIQALVTRWVAQVRSADQG